MNKIEYFKIYFQIIHLFKQQQEIVKISLIKNKKTVKNMSISQLCDANHIILNSKNSLSNQTHTC